MIDEKVIMELKTLRTLDPAHEAQLINYLKTRPPRLIEKPMAGRQQILRSVYY